MYQVSDQPVVDDDCVAPCTHECYEWTRLLRSWYQEPPGTWCYVKLIVFNGSMHLLCAVLKSDW